MTSKISLSSAAFPQQLVGGGIGGRTAVLTLLRAGHRVTCFEQAAEPDELGAGIQLGPNATCLLHRLGLTDALTRVAVTPARIQFRRGTTGWSSRN